MGPTVGVGAFGEVISIIHKKTREIRAVKKVKKRNGFDETVEDIKNEMKVLKLLDHENILKFYEYFEDKRHFYIVTDFCRGGALYDEIHSRGKFPEMDAAVLVKSLLKALSHCHKNNIVHRDLKPENICFQDQRKCLNGAKIIDFGTAIAITEGMTLHAKRGSVFYLAPEVIAKNYGPKCDLWSLGGITFCLLSGFPPFNGGSEFLITEKVKKGDYSFDKNVWRSISAECKDFISKLLEKNVDKRLSADEALEHPWIVNADESKVSPWKQNKHSREFELMEEIRALVKTLPKPQNKEQLKILEKQPETSRLSERQQKTPMGTVKLLQSIEGSIQELAKDEMKEHEKKKGKDQHSKKGEAGSQTSRSRTVNIEMTNQKNEDEKETIDGRNMKNLLLSPLYNSCPTKQEEAKPSAFLNTSCPVTTCHQPEYQTFMSIES